jgi:predicted DNA-binding WGR domain protein
LHRPCPTLLARHYPLDRATEADRLLIISGLAGKESDSHDDVERMRAIRQSNGPSHLVLADPSTTRNRWGSIDSSFALDAYLSARDNGHKLQMLVLERPDASCNIAGFYVLAIEPMLFGDAALVREWGRLGSTSRRRLDLHATAQMAAEALDIWLARKARRSYRISARATFPVFQEN